MKNKEKQAGREPFSPAGILFDILLLLVNSVGIVGALTEILEIPWKEVQKGQTRDWIVRVGLDSILFWGGLFCSVWR